MAFLPTTSNENKTYPNFLNSNRSPNSKCNCSYLYYVDAQEEQFLFNFPYALLALASSPRTRTRQIHQRWHDFLHSIANLLKSTLYLNSNSGTKITAFAKFFFVVVRAFQTQQREQLGDDCREMLEFQQRRGDFFWYPHNIEQMWCWQRIRTTSLLFFQSFSRAVVDFQFHQI